MNTGIYLPTTGHYVFDYVTNSFDQSIASQMNHNGYTSYVFHYNDPSFYSRGVFEPAMGYESYVCYEDYVTEENKKDLYDDQFLFDNDAINADFFRDGPTFNFIITRSAHLSYKYNEVLSHWALKKYPQYRGLTGHEELDCMYVKARLVDDLFARMLRELEEKGQLHNTVIVAYTDHYTYGFKDLDVLYAQSGVEDALLLEKTPCFIWSADKPSRQVDKTLFTADLVPTMLNLLGIESPYNYLGQDAFDPNYEGCAYFPDGSWIADGVVAFRNSSTAGYDIIANKNDIPITEEYMRKMQQKAESFIKANNAMLPCDYYETVR
jgi:phosphoglycerol transferase MdoB-like AlkP superfamily enzyme